LISPLFLSARPERIEKSGQIGPESDTPHFHQFTIQSSGNASLHGVYRRSVPNIYRGMKTGITCRGFSATAGEFSKGRANIDTIQ
jgi:hypothetical protein